MNEQTLTSLELIKAKIKRYPGFPKEGIIFEDLSPIYLDPQTMKLLTQKLVELCTPFGKLDYIIGIESRGFIMGTVLAQALGCGFVAIRKKGKLPGKLKAVDYQLEYGTATIEIQELSELKGSRVLVFDDVFATGGTMQAALKLLQGTVDYAALGVIMDIHISEIENLGVDCFVALEDKTVKLT